MHITVILKEQFISRNWSQYISIGQEFDQKDLQVNFLRRNRMSSKSRKNL